MQSPVPGDSVDLGNVHESIHSLFKIVLIGDEGVGKTSVVQRFKHGVYVERHGNTVGVDFMVRTLDVDGKKIQVSIVVKLNSYSAFILFLCVNLVVTLTPRL